MRALLVGYGSIGRRHLANFHELGIDDWAVVHTGQGTLPLDPPCPVRTYPDLAAALEQERPAFAIVANPTNGHLSTTRACIAADCAVLLEKPVSDSLEGLDELAATASSRSASILVGFQFRFHPALRRIKQLLMEGSLGTPLHVRAVWGEYLPSWHPWEDWRTGYAARADLGGGVHHTICHPIDYLRMLFGEPMDLSATLTTNGPLGLSVAEAADVLFQFDTGVVAQLHLDYWAQPSMHRLEVVCTRGTIHWDYRSDDFRVWDSRSEQWLAEQHPGLAERNDLFVAEARHFLAVVKGEAEPLCTLDDGIAVARLCDEIERSAQ